MTHTLLDTGPLVALLDRAEKQHDWAVQQAAGLPARLLTCEAVISEAHFLTQNLPRARDLIARWFDEGWIQIGFDLQRHHAAAHALMTRYSSVPMSLADACLVRMSELHTHSRVFTLDSDFRIYRRNKRQPIPLICPA
jgi:predicted nucleic acid-binding protein